MGMIRNIKASIDDKSSMSVNSITLLASALMGVVVGLVMCFVLIYDVTYDGKVDTDMGDMAMLLMSSGIYILGSGVPKAYVDYRMKNRSWVEGDMLRKLRVRWLRKKNNYFSLVDDIYIEENRFKRDIL